MPPEHEPRRAKESRHKHDTAQEPQEVDGTESLDVELIDEADETADARHVGTDFPLEVDYRHEQHRYGRTHHEHREPLWRVAIVEIVGSEEPDKELTAKYENRYQAFKKLYPACKSFYDSLKLN